MMCLAQTRCSTRPSSAPRANLLTPLILPLYHHPVCQTLPPTHYILRKLSKSPTDHLSSPTMNSSFQTSLIRHDRDRHGGGITMFILESLSFSVRQIHSDIERPSALDSRVDSTIGPLQLIRPTLERKSYNLGVRTQSS